MLWLVMLVIMGFVFNPSPEVVITVGALWVLWVIAGTLDRLTTRITTLENQLRVTEEAVEDIMELNSEDELFLPG